MDVATFIAATGCSRALAQRWCGPLSAAMQERDISTSLRQAPFIANVGHESGGFVHTRELWGPTPEQLRYERDPSAPWPTSAEQAATAPFARNRKAYRLGNSEPGDGFRFRGRGLIQTTGRENHALTGEALGLDLIEHPEQLEQDINAARSAAWFWAARKLNELADSESFARIVQIINGGANGYPDRVERWLRARRVLGV